uniref:Phosphatidylinositol glycan anchor biosynthesis class U protein-like isoform X1 n=1 Tax=Rhizophora mucronata TaxID=61149 RepID=A0A2P2KZU4_RHIMU
MMTRFSIGEVDRPTHAAIVKGFHRYTRAAISPEGIISESFDASTMLSDFKLSLYNLNRLSPIARRSKALIISAMIKTKLHKI